MSDNSHILMGRGSGMGRTLLRIYRCSRSEGYQVQNSCASGHYASYSGRRYQYDDRGDVETHKQALCQILRGRGLEAQPPRDFTDANPQEVTVRTTPDQQSPKSLNVLKSIPE